MPGVEYSPVIQDTWGLKQENHKFQASLSNLVRPCLGHTHTHTHRTFKRGWHCSIVVKLSSMVNIENNGNNQKAMIPCPWKPTAKARPSQPPSPPSSVLSHTHILSESRHNSGLHLSDILGQRTCLTTASRPVPRLVIMGSEAIHYLCLRYWRLWGISKPYILW